MPKDATLKYKIIAQNSRTGARLVLCSLGGHEWFSPIKPNCTENHYRLAEAWNKVAELRNYIAVSVLEESGVRHYESKRFVFLVDDVPSCYTC